MLIEVYAREVTPVCAACKKVVKRLAVSISPLLSKILLLQRITSCCNAILAELGFRNSPK
jgi:hypothetical protein